MKTISDYQFIKKLQSLPWIEELWLFGSRARGDNYDRSDIDLAVVCPSASVKEWDKIMAVIEEADTLLKIDCVRFDTLPKNDPFALNIVRYKKVLYKKE